MDSLITQESATFLQQIDDFLKSAVIDVEISEVSQAQAARLLGNELQKQKTQTEKQCKKEIAPLKVKIAELQKPFEARLALIEEKRDILGGSLTLWDRKVELTRQEKQRLLDEEARKAREAQEAEARRQRQLEEDNRRKAEEARKAAEQASDAEKQRLLNEAAAADRRAASAASKAEIKETTAAAIVAPVVQEETKEEKKGQKTIDDPVVKIIDADAFIRWCLDTEQTHFLIIDEKKLIARAKERGGKFETTGISVIINKRISFTGR